MRRAIVHVEGVEDAFNMGAGGIDAAAAAVVGSDHDLALEQIFSIVRGQARSQQPAQTGGVGVLGIAAHRTAFGETHIARDGWAGEGAGGAFGGGCEATIRVVQQLVAVAHDRSSRWWVYRPQRALAAVTVMETGVAVTV